MEYYVDYNTQNKKILLKKVYFYLCLLSSGYIPQFLVQNSNLRLQCIFSCCLFIVTSLHHIIVPCFLKVFLL